MRFNIVIGNPPYNNDIYLDFVTLGYKVCSDYTSMITPAKWQAKGGEKNKAFRDSILQHIQKVIYYKDTKDIFDIGEPDGVCYYLIDKNKISTEKLVKNICSSNKYFQSDYELHTESELILLRNDIISIVNKLGNNKLIDRIRHEMIMDNSDYGNKTKSEDDVAIVCAEKGISGYSKCNKLNIDEIEKYKCYIHCLVSQGSGSPFDKNGFAVGGGKKRVYIAEPQQVPQGHYFLLWLSNSLEEAKSFVSFCDSKLISFLYFIGISASMEVIENWRFIPDPLKFDHIFTDNELYNKYNLTQEEIDIIESNIRERK